ncbi:MAG: hypothetical protein KGM98_13685 [Bacteroidota bacterium]|nr:hypothetical protein [Bacteroidota bacterium]
MKKAESKRGHIDIPHFLVPKELKTLMIQVAIESSLPFSTKRVCNETNSMKLCNLGCQINNSALFILSESSYKESSG